MYFTETMFNPEYINPPYFKQQQTQMKNPATREFTRSYKAHNARVRYGTMTKAEFTAWSKDARAKRADCVAGKLSLEDFVAWLDSNKQR